MPFFDSARLTWTNLVRGESQVGVALRHLLEESGYSPDGTDFQGFVKPEDAAYTIDLTAEAAARVAGDAASVATANTALVADRLGREAGAARTGEVGVSNVIYPVGMAERYGAIGDGVTDDSVAIGKATTAATLLGVPFRLLPGKTYYTGTTTTTIVGACECTGATIRYAGTGVALLVGSAAAYTRRARVMLPAVIQALKTVAGWAQAGGSDIGVRLLNLDSSEITVPHVQSFAIGLDVRGEGRGCAYNHIRIDHLDNNQINCRTSADATGWSNENNYHGGRYSFNSPEGTAVVGTRHVHILSGLANAANNNRWWGASFEGDVPQYHVECGGPYNHFMLCRWEATTPSVLFTGADASSSTIYHGYNAQSLNVTQTGGAVRNHLETRSGSVKSLQGTRPEIVNNPSGAASPVRVVVGASADPYAVDATTAYAWLQSEQVLKGKRVGDAFDRIIIDALNGQILFGNGTVAPTAGIASSGSLGIGLLGRHGFFGNSAIVQPVGAAQAAVTIVNTDNAIGGLTISAAYSQAEVQALRNATETLADDVRNLAALVSAMRTALVNLGLIKGSA